MSPTAIPISRRTFLQAGAAFAAGLNNLARAQIATEGARFNDEDIPTARNTVLKLLNAERASAGFPPLKLDELACQVAEAHALDMVKGQFLSHWGTDGRKPYHRYSFAGGIDAIQENVSSLENIEALTAKAVTVSLIDMHTSMYTETPPKDGHHQTIIYPYHTHVGFGIALRDYRLRMDQIYVSKYVLLDPIQRRAARQATIIVSGRLLNRAHIIKGAQVYYESLPTPPAIDWLRTPRSYGMPEDPVQLLVKLPADYYYVNGAKGTLEVRRDGRFRVPVNLFRREPGLYTIMLWLKRNEKEPSFPATQICIRCE